MVRAVHQLQKEARCKECRNAQQVLITAHETCLSFLKSFIQIRDDRKAKGTPTDLEQDLLRAMIVFASSGLDAVIKQLVNDALPTVIGKNGGENGASANFSSFVEKKISNDPKLANRLISSSITSINSRDWIMKWFVSRLLDDSLQSKDQVLQIASYFDIPSAKLTNSLKSLSEVFSIRNLIIHEMDVDLKGKNRKRNPRKRDDVIKNVNLLFEVAENFLAEVHNKCEAK